MRMYLLLVVLFIIGCISSVIDADPGPERIRIELSPSNRLAIGDIDDFNHFSIRDHDGNDLFHEIVTQIPSHYTVIDTFFICVQPEQEMFRLYGASENDLQFYSSNGTPLYTDLHVDCIISVCVVRDQNEEELVIIDTNNDEDLTNDPVLTFVFHVFDNTVLFNNQDLDYTYWCVDTEAAVDFYDGTSIKTMTMPLRFYRKLPVWDNTYQCRLNLMQIGHIEIEGERYTTGVLLYSKIELHRNQGYWNLHYTQRLWIDTNKNGQFDLDDFYDTLEMSELKTILNRTYTGIEYDRFGRYMVLERMDSETHPPVAIGLPAPVFKGETIDGNTFDLAAKQDQYVLMDFWGSWCDPCIGELPNLKAAYEQFGEKICFVSIGVEDDRNELVSCIEEHGLGWTHLYSPFDGMIPERYQVHSYPSMFLIGPDGTMVAWDKDLRGENLIPTLEKFLK